MKQHRTKPRPTAPKGKRWPFSSPEERRKYVDRLAELEYLDYVDDLERAKYIKSEKYKKAADLAEQFKKRGR